jgi:hypothetical protein
MQVNKNTPTIGMGIPPPTMGVGNNFNQIGQNNGLMSSGIISNVTTTDSGIGQNEQNLSQGVNGNPLLILEQMQRELPTRGSSLLIFVPPLPGSGTNVPTIRTGGIGPDGLPDHIVQPPQSGTRLSGLPPVAYDSGEPIQEEGMTGYEVSTLAQLRLGPKTDPNLMITDTGLTLGMLRARGWSFDYIKSIIKENWKQLPPSFATLGMGQFMLVWQHPK